MVLLLISGISGYTAKPELQVNFAYKSIMLKNQLTNIMVLIAALFEFLFPGFVKRYGSFLVITKLIITSYLILTNESGV